MGAASGLTRRGTEIAQLVGLGLTNREIARKLFLSERTVEWHVLQVMNRLGFTSRTQIATWVARSDNTSPVRVPGARRRGNLPAALTSFVGRDRELAAVAELAGAHRLVTVTGPGGTGKTRLALRVAERLESSYPDGAWWCDLAPLTDPALFGDAVVQALGLNAGSADRLAAASDHLRDRECILVLDNCEHLVSPAAEAARRLLSAAPGLRIVATSRVPLGVAGEAVWRLDALPSVEAIELFAQRAAAAAPGFHIAPANAGAVETICERLDGMPLALELVAPRLRVSSVQELAKTALEQLAGDAPYDMDRHGSLGAVAAWSYRLLTPAEQGLFRRLGVFAGWFELDDAIAVMPDAPEVLPTLSALVEKSMVVIDQTAAGTARYRLLEMLKEFARRRLADAGELDQVALLHAERMVWLNEQVGFDYLDEFKPKLALMVDDTRAALRTLIHQQPKRAAWLAGTLRKFWSMTGRAQEGARWCEAVLEAGPEPSVERSWLELTHTILRERSGRPLEESGWLDDPVAVASRPENRPMAGHMFLAAGLLNSDLERREIAEDLFRRSVACFEEQGDELNMNAARNNLAGELLSVGRLEEAIEMQKQTVDSQRRLHGSEISYFIDTLAQAYALSGAAEKARALELEAMLSLAPDQPVVAAINVHGLAWAAAMRGKTEAALRLHYYASGVFAEAGVRNTEPLGPTVYAAMERLETEVGPETCDRLRAQGQALSLEEAIALARSEG
jgi:predicted ATPase/DNA-binding CsgD family transcriptional regulator